MSTWVIRDGERVRIPSNVEKRAEATHLFSEPEAEKSTQRGISKSRSKSASKPQAALKEEAE